MGHVLGMHYQRFTNMPLWTRRLPQIVLHIYTKAKVDIWKCITQPKKFGKRKQTWDKTCVDYGLRLRKLSTLVNTRFNILFLILLWSISWVANYAKGSRHLINVVLILFYFFLQVCKSCFIIKKCTNISKCHYTMLQQVDYYIT